MGKGRELKAISYRRMPIFQKLISYTSERREGCSYSGAR
jgi:hypothetical protein